MKTLTSSRKHATSLRDYLTHAHLNNFYLTAVLSMLLSSSAIAAPAPGPSPSASPTAAAAAAVPGAVPTLNGEVYCAKPENIAKSCDDSEDLGPTATLCCGRKNIVTTRNAAIKDQKGQKAAGYIWGAVAVTCAIRIMDKKDSFNINIKSKKGSSKLDPCTVGTTAATVADAALKKQWESVVPTLMGLVGDRKSVV